MIYSIDIKEGDSLTKFLLVEAESMKEAIGRVDEKYPDHAIKNMNETPYHEILT